MKTKKWFAIVAVMVTMALMITGAAQATDMYGLIAGTTNTWNTTAQNWSTTYGGPFNSTWVQGSGAILTNGTTGVIGTAFTIGAPITLTKLIFGGGLNATIGVSGGGSLTFSGASSYLIDNSQPPLNSGNSTITVPIYADTGTLHFKEKISNVAIALNVSNNFAGAVHIDVGRITIGHAKALTGASGVIVSNNAVLGINGVNVSNVSVTLNGTGGGNNGGSALEGGSSAGDLWAGNVVLNTDSSIGDRNGTLTNPFVVSGPISENGGPRALIINSAGKDGNGVYGQGVVKLSGANTYSGVTTVRASTLLLGTNAPSGAAGALGNTTSSVVLGDGPITFTPANIGLLTDGPFTVGRNITVANYGTNTTLGGNQSSGISTFTGTITLNKAVTLQAKAGSEVDFTTGKITGVGGVTNTGGGTILVSGANDYSGGTVATNITLLTDNASALGSGLVTLQANSTLKLLQALTISNLSGTAGTYVNLNGNTLTVNQGGTSSFAGAITNNGGLVKGGAGQLTLSGNNSFKGGMALNNGTLVLSGSNTGGGGAVLVSGGNLTVDGSLTGSGAVTVNSGNVTVNGSLMSNGSVAINGGKLNANGSLVAASGISVAAGATLGGSGVANGGITVDAGGLIEAGQGGSGTLTLDSLTFNGTATNIFGNLSNYSVVPCLFATNLAVFGCAGSIALTVGTAGGVGGSGTVYRLIGFTGAINGTGLPAFTLATTLPNRGSYLLTTNINAGELDLQILGADALKWQGDTTSWDTSSSGNWKLSAGGTLTTYVDSPADAVIFDDSAPGTSVVDISAADVHPAQITFNNTALDYTVQGSKAIAGSTGLTKDGGGSLILVNANTFNGVTTINGGTLQLGNGTTDGSIASSSGIANNGALVYNLTGAQTYANVISGTGSLAKEGGGTLTLTATNAYSGMTTISGGILQLGNGTLDGSIASSSEIANNGALVCNLIGTQSYTNVISGSGTLTKTGGGTLTLTGVNTYSGVTTISGGSLQIGNGTTDGSILNSGGITNNASLIYNLAGTQTCDTDIKGSGALIKRGVGTLKLNCLNTYNSLLDGGVLQFMKDSTGVKVLYFGAALGSSSASTLDLTEASVTATSLVVQVNSSVTNTITIGAGKTLTVNGGFSMDTSIGGSGYLTARGAGSMNIDSVSSTFLIGATSDNNTRSFVIDLSDLSGGFTARVSNFYVGRIVNIYNNVPNVFFKLAPNSSITAGDITIGDDTTFNGGNGGGQSITVSLNKGTSYLKANSMTVGRIKSGTQTLNFIPDGGTVVLSGTNGISALGTMYVGYKPHTGSTADVNGVADFSNGTVIGAVTSLYVGYQTSNGGNGAPNAIGTFTLGSSGDNSLSVANLYIGNATLADSGKYAVGTFTLNGGVMTAGTIAMTSEINGHATLNINGGTLTANGTITGSSSANEVITLNGSSAVLDMTGHNIGVGTNIINTFTFTAGKLQNIGTNYGPITLVGSGTHEFKQDSGVNGVLAGMISGGVAGMIKTGTNTLTIAYTNTYSGTTVIQAGILRQGTNNAIPRASALTLTAGSTLDMNGYSSTAQSLAGTGTLKMSATNTLALTGALTANLEVVFDPSGLDPLMKYDIVTCAGTPSGTYTCGPKPWALRVTEGKLTLCQVRGTVIRVM